MDKKNAEYVVRDFSAVDQQVAEMAKRERGLTWKLRIDNLKRLGIPLILLACALAILILALGVFIWLVQQERIVEVEKIVEVTREVPIVSEKIKQSQLTPRLNIDLEIALEKIDSKFFRILKQFEPFGPKNPNPKFISENILINNYRAIGMDKSHLKCVVDNGKGLKIEAIGFGLAKKIEFINKSKVTNQLIIHDIK